ncbi:hypothetical protein COT99_02455 [Candidatus Falkowbacteria bacterium CG10_big_fil_rev_8_21_14_0_10_43_10]|uniref:Uncharacterized protein n=1 Tax=Candidatus Falkowbacteria bacterium CG10_big_fil_rev_8_21_14_0_10_43_10 TaxID=1974567 RepID=A0A2H0V260_9BACT|nr:MAG: hypothetical protein COT99_02455 [Candidatus Falkowbacteria bacterium CG10_big_fil_rev_8_21_14_0_10_43_10]
MAFPCPALPLTRVSVSNRSGANESLARTSIIIELSSLRLALSLFAVGLVLLLTKPLTITFPSGAPEIVIAASIKFHDANGTGGV